MVLFVASLANVSWQGINPPGAGGNPLVYPATTLATLADWSPESCCSFPTGPASLPVDGSRPVKRKRRLNFKRLFLF